MNINKTSKGFALVELVVGIAIAAIVSGMVMSIVQFSSQSFQNTTEEEQTLVKAQVVTSQLNDYIINTKDAVCYYVQDTLVSNDQNYEDITSGSTNDLGNVTRKKISLYDTVNDTIREQTIEWNKSTEELWLDEDTSDGKAAVLLAKNVESFSTDLSEAFTAKKIVVMVKVRMNDQSYSVNSKTITLRNAVLINEIPTEADESAAVFTKTITGVTLSPNSATINAGEQQVFETKIIANYAVNANSEYYIVVGDSRVKEIPGVCSIDNSGTLKANDTASFVTQTVQIESVPIEVSSGSYTQEEQRSLTGTAEVTITSKSVTGTQLVGSATIEEGESQNYEAIVSGYTGISQDSYFYFKDGDGNRVSSKSGASISNYSVASNEKLITCEGDLSQDEIIVLYAVPQIVDEATTLTEAQKEALTGVLTITLRKKIQSGNDLYFTNKVTTMYPGESFQFIASGLNDSEHWYFEDSSDYDVARISNSSYEPGTVTVKDSAVTGDSFTVWVKARNNGDIMYARQKVVVKAMDFQVLDGNTTMEDTVYSYYNDKNKPMDYDYTLQLYYGNELILNDLIESTEIEYETYYYQNKNRPEEAFVGLKYEGDYIDSYIDKKNDDTFTFTINDDDKKTKNKDAYLKITVTVTLKNGYDYSESRVYNNIKK